MDELVDVVSFNNDVIYQEYKSTVHKNGLLHRAVHLWIIREQQNDPLIILQKRGYDKKLLPGRFDVAVAGHLMAGETPEMALCREALEEIGLEPDQCDLTYAGKRIEVYEDEKIKNFEICYVYILKDNHLLSEYRIGYPEVQGICEIKLSSLKQLFQEKYDKIEAPGLFFDRNGVIHETSEWIYTDSFIPRIDNYCGQMCEIISQLSSKKTFSIL